MDIFPKFIIEDDRLIIGKVTFHKQLVVDKQKVKGGGFYNFDIQDRSFTFYGESNDFGKATLENVKKCIDDTMVFIRKRNVTEDYNFYYSTGSEIVTLRLKK